MKLNDVFIDSVIPTGDIAPLPQCQMWYHRNDAQDGDPPMQCTAFKQGSHDMFCANHQSAYWSNGEYHIRCYKSVPERHFIPPHHGYTHSDGITRDEYLLGLISIMHRHTVRIDKEIAKLSASKAQRTNLITELLLL